MAKKRDALRMLPKYDPDNDIGAVDRIRFAMINNRMDALTQPEHDQFKRWKQIDDLLRDKRVASDLRADEFEDVGSRRRLRNYLIVKYEISWDTAERDIKNAIKLFTPVDDEKEYFRSVYIEDIEAAARKALTAMDFNAYKGLMQLAGEWRRFGEKEVEVQVDKFQAFRFIIQYNPEAVGLKTIENKDEVFARWQKRKAASDRMAEEADDAIVV